MARRHRINVTPSGFTVSPQSDPQWIDLDTVGFYDHLFAHPVSNDRWRHNANIEPNPQTFAAAMTGPNTPAAVDPYIQRQVNPMAAFGGARRRLRA